MDKDILNLHHGDCGKVKSIDAGKCANRRLYEMGLNVGASIKIIKNDAGPIIVSIGGNKIALGRGLASKIILEVGDH